MRKTILWVFAKNTGEELEVEATSLEMALKKLGITMNDEWYIKETRQE